MINNQVSYPSYKQTNLIVTNPNLTNNTNPILMAQQPNITPPEANTTINNHSNTNPFDYFMKNKI